MNRVSKPAAHDKINNTIREHNSVLVNSLFKLINRVVFLSSCFWEKLKDFFWLAFVLVPSNFLPFGNGEIVTPRLENGSSEVIKLQQPFKFFGRTHNQTFVRRFICCFPYLDEIVSSTCIGNEKSLQKSTTRVAKRAIFPGHVLARISIFPKISTFWLCFHCADQLLYDKVPWEHTDRYAQCCFKLNTNMYTYLHNVDRSL